ncbi:MAG: fumarylacetoacetase, partial [Flavobacteriales bacterium]|nr:fumarylacetoacetase [Flavobacteriales bacterium]
MIEANNPNLKTWLEVIQSSDFPIQNIPFGIANINNSKFGVSRIGDTVINLSKSYELGAFHGILSENY